MDRQISNIDALHILHIEIKYYWCCCFAFLCVCDNDDDDDDDDANTVTQNIYGERDTYNYKTTNENILCTRCSLYMRYQKYLTTFVFDHIPGIT